MKQTWLLLSSVLTLTFVAAPALAKGTDGAAKSAKTTSPVSGDTAAKSPAAPAAPKAPPAKPAAAKAPAKPAAKAPAKLAKAAKSKGPCYARPVQLVRVRGEVVEPREVSLTLCNGKPNPSALDTVSVLARPRDVVRPLPAEIRAYRARPVAKGRVPAKSKRKYRDPLFVTEHVMRVHPGLLVRLQRIANRYPGKIIEIISGYRPDARDTSRHHHGRALDLRVAGITRERLRDFLRTFEQTGVGYYPNSYFVHMDVRDTKGYWVDRSGPGEPPDYGPWPDPSRRLSPRLNPSRDPVRDSILKEAFAEIEQLGKVPTSRTVDKRTALAHRAPTKLREPEQEADDMSQDEVARVRDEARRALEQL